MKKVIITFIWVIFNCIQLHADSGKSIPGYLGSKNTLCFSIMPNIYPTFNNLPMMSITYERVLTRKSCISIAYGYKSGKINETDYSKFESHKNDLMVIYDGSEALTFYKGYITYSQKQYSISKTNYILRLGSIAPQGKFIRYGFTLNEYRIQSDSMTYSMYGNNKTLYFKAPSSDYKTKRLGFINFEYGSTRFVSKNIFIRKAIAFNLPLNFWETTSFKVYNNIEDFNESNLGSFISQTQKLNLTLGIGIAF